MCVAEDLTNIILGSIQKVDSTQHGPQQALVPCIADLRLPI
jgi:hypothetical protein